MYAKIETGNTRPTFTDVDDEHDESELISEGYLPFDGSPFPDTPAPRGFAWSDVYSVLDGRVVQSWELVESVPEPRSLSKVRLMRALKARELWTPVKAFIAASEDYADEWELSTTLDEDNALIVSAVAALKQQLGLTDEQVEGILAASVAE